MMREKNQIGEYKIKQSFVSAYVWNMTSKFHVRIARVAIPVTIFIRVVFSNGKFFEQ